MIFKKKKPKPVVKCTGTWTEKRLVHGEWVTYKRYCSREQGHSGSHR